MAASVEISQMMSIANQLTGFYMRGTLFSIETSNLIFSESDFFETFVITKTFVKD